MTVTTVLSLRLVQFVNLDFMCIMVDVLLHRASAIGHASGPQLVVDAQQYFGRSPSSSPQQVVIFRTPAKGLSAGPVLEFMLMHNTISDESLLQDLLF